MKRKYLWKKKFLTLVLSTIIVFSSADTTALAVGGDVAESAEEEAEQSETMESMKETKLSDSDEGEKETDNDGTQDDGQELLEKEDKDAGETFETESSASIIGETEETEETEKKSYASVEKYTEIEAETEFETYGNETVSNGSSNDLNTAVYDKLNKYRSDSVFGSGVIWGGTTDGSYNWNGWKQCCGFALQFANTVFGTYPTTLRRAANGATYAGWTCYYVTADNYNTLTVEPGDIIDSPSGYDSSGNIKHHTAMVLSSNNSNFTCVQCNYKSGDGVYNKIHYGEYFNYNTNRSSLPKLWAVYGGYTDSGSHAMRLWKPSDSLKRGATGSTSGGSDTPSVSHGCDASITVNNPSNNSIIEGNFLNIELSIYDYHGIKSYSVTVKHRESGEIASSWSDNLSGSCGYQISTICLLQRDDNYEITVNIGCTNGSKYSQTSYFTISNPNCHTGENDGYGGSIKYSTEYGDWAEISGCLNDMHGIGTCVENVYLVEDDEEILVKTETTNNGNATGGFILHGYTFENYGLHKFTLTQTCQSGYVHYYEFYLNYEDPNAEPEDVCHASGTLTSSEPYDITNKKTITLFGNVHDDSGLTAYDIYYRLIDETEEKLYCEQAGFYGEVTDAEFEENFTFPDYGTYYISLKVRCANQPIHEVDSLVLTCSDHSGKIGDILWDVDENGHLTITGKGDYINYITSSTGNPPWSRKDVKTAKVSVTGITSTANMFHDCSNLINVNLSELDTSNVTDMMSMFRDCKSLASLDLSTFQTENVTDMSEMFSGCSSLTTLDLSSFDLNGLKDETSLCFLCDALKTIYTPINLSVTIPLESSIDFDSELQDGNWYQGETVITELPKNLDYSIRITKGQTSAVKDAYITAAKKKTVYECNDVLNLDDLKVYYYGTDGKVTLVTDYTTNKDRIDMSVTGTKELCITYKDGEKELVTTVKLTVKDKGSDDNEDDKTKKTVSYDMQGHGTQISAVTVNSGEKLTVPTAPTAEGYTFEGWYKEAVCINAWDFDKDTVTADVALYAKWTKNAAGSEDEDDKTKKTVSYDMQGHGAQIGAVTVKSGEKLTAPTAPTAEGYTFGGWYKEAACINAWDFDKDTVTADMTLYAKWTKNAAGSDDEADKTKKTVSYDMQGHGAQIGAVTVNSGEKLTAPTAPTAEGYTFGGWYKEAACINAWDFDKDTVTADMTLYAKWTKKATGSDADVDNDDDDSAYTQDERVDLSTVSGTIANIKPKVYDGNPYEPIIKVTVMENGKKKTLTEGTDYRVSYANNINAGTDGTVTVKGNGIYKGELTASLIINQKPVKKVKLVTGSMAVGDRSALPVYLYDGVKQLTEGMDYSVQYDKNLTAQPTNAAMLTVNGLNNYTGSVTTKLVVYEWDASQIINPSNVTLSVQKTPYTGKAIKTVEPQVKIGATTLQPNKDYKVQYQNNKNAGTAYVIVTGKGAYKGKVVKSFEIIPVTSSLEIKSIPEKTYNGKLQKPSIIVTTGGKKLSPKKDYSITYTKNLHAGAQTAQVLVMGKGNYAGAQGKAVFTINPQKIAKASVKGAQGSLTLTYSKRVLKEGTDYTLQYGAITKNKVEVTITGKGDFVGSVTKKVNARASDGNDKEDDTKEEASKEEASKEDDTKEEASKEDDTKEDEKERAISEKLEAVYKELNLASLSQIDKIEKIYDYVINHVTYDSESEMRYTLYGALVEGKAVCNGYALLMERMLTDNGISTQYIAGIGLSCTGGPARHAWNIVEYNGFYYNIDATWDCTNGKKRQWFMKSQVDFEDHVRDAQYNTDEFLNRYPMAKRSYGEDGPLPKYENADYTFNVAGGGTVSTSTVEDKKAAILIFGRTSCGNTMSFLSALKEKELCKDSNIKIIFADVDKNNESTVASFQKQYGTDDMYFCYDTTGGTAGSAIWQYYYKKYSGGEAFILPLLVVIDSENTVRFIQSYPVFASQIEECLDRLEE